MSGSPICLKEDNSQFRYPRLNSNSTAERKIHQYVEQQRRNPSPRIGETRPTSHATIHDQAEHESSHQQPRITTKDPHAYSLSSSSFWTRDNFSQRPESIGNQQSDPRNEQYPVLPTEPNGGSHIPTPPEEFYRPNPFGVPYPESDVHYPPPPDMSRHQDFGGDGPTRAEGRYQAQYAHRNCFEPPPITQNQRFTRYNGDHVDSDHARNYPHYEDRSQNRTRGDCGHSGCNVEHKYQRHSPSFQFSKYRPPWQPPVYPNRKSHRYSGQQPDMIPSHYNHRGCPNGEQEMRDMKESLREDMEAERRANKECIQTMMEKVEAENRATTIARAAEMSRIEEMVSLIQRLEQRVKQSEAQQGATQTYTEQGRPWIGPWGGPMAGMQFKTAGRDEAGWPGATQPSPFFMHPSAQPFAIFGPSIDHQSIRHRYNDTRPFEEVLPVLQVVPQPPPAIFNAGGGNHIFGCLSNKSSSGDGASSLPDTQSWQHFHQKLQRQMAAYEALLILESPQSAYAKVFPTPPSSSPMEDWSQFDSSQGREYNRYYDEQSYHLRDIIYS